MPKKVVKKNKNTRISWDDLFMGMAQVLAQRSSCIYHPIGAVFVDEKNRVISNGYSGASRGDINCSEVGYCIKIDGDLKSGKIKRCNGAHAEMNAIANARGGAVFENSTLYSSVFPCYDCMKVLNNLGVKRIVYEKIYERLIDGGGGIKKELEQEAWDLAKKRKIKIEKYKIRDYRSIEI